MKKTKSLILLIIAVICAVNLSAESRVIGCDVSCNTDYTPDSSTVLNFDVNITGSSYDMADYVEFTLPEGIIPISATNLSGQSSSINGQHVMWGDMSSWTGSGAGTIIGNSNVSVSVTIDPTVSGDQTMDWEVMGDDPYELDIVNGEVVINQLAVGPIISLDTNQVVFEPTLLNISSTKTINITNIGIDELNITNITNSNPEAFTISDYATSVSTEDVLALEVTFAPTAFNVFNSTLTITSNGGIDREVTLEGIGVTDYNVVESFEGIFPPIGWTNNGGVWDQSDDHPFSGTYSAICGGNTNDYLITPKLDIKANDRVILHASNGYSNVGGIEVAISVDGESWTTLSTTSFEEIYKTINVDLNSFVGSYYLGFKRDGNRYTHIDEIVIPEFDTASQEPLEIVLLSPTNNATEISRDAELSWNVDPFSDGYLVSLGSNENADNIIESYDVGTLTTYSPATLDWSTTYYWNVVGYNDNGESVVTSNWTFTTEANSIITPPHTELFSTYIPAFWTEAKGIMSDNTTFESTTSSNWGADGFCNDGTEGSARLNIYGTSCKHWLLTPTIDLISSDLEISFDLGLTAYSGTAASNLGEDDIFAVLISTDNGTTWSSNNILRQWTSSDNISNTGENITIPLNEYSGLVKVAFYGESTISNVDVNVYIDNFKVLPEQETPILGQSLAEITFADLAVGNNSENKTITFSNEGSGTLRINGISLTDTENFQLVDANEYDLELTNNTIEVTVQFTPQTAAEHTTNLVVDSSLGMIEIPVSGLSYEPLPGDLVENAIDIEFDEDGNFTATGTIENYYNDYDLPGNNSDDVVYLLSLDNSAVANFSLLQSSFDTKLGIYAEGVTPGNDNYLFYNDNYDGRVAQSALNNIELEAGIYYLVIDSYTGATGNYQLDINATIQSVEASVVISPVNYDYTEMVIGSSSEICNFNISNNGETSFIINDITVSGNNFDLFFNGSLPIEITDNSYTIGARFTPNEAGDISEEITVATNAGDYTLELTGFGFDENTYYESFENENYPPNGWLTVDNDGDENGWRPWSGTYARTGDHFVMSNTASMWGDIYHPDNWMITPQVTVRENDSMVFYVRPMNPEIPGDSYEIKVSTTNTNISSFSTTIFTEETTSEIWARREIDLSDYVGQDIYIAFHHFENTDDTYAFGIDDIFLPPLTVNNAPQATTNIYPEDDSEYIYGTTALYWNRVVTADNYILNFGTSNPPTNIYDGIELGNVISKVVNNLEPNTTYYWQVIPANGQGEAVNNPIWNFTTDEFNNLTVPHQDNFDTYTSMPFFPLGWTEFKGVFDQVNNYSTVNDYLGWGLSRFGNQEGDNKALSIEYSTSNNANWAISPIINLGDDPEADNLVRFDIALTKITTTQEASLGFDDKLILLISQDGGVTWNEDSILKTWNSNDNISNTGQSESIMLTGYSGQVVLAFYAESTTPTESCMLFIDNLYVGEQATEPIISVLPQSQNFPLTQVNNMSDSKIFRVNNIGIGTLNIESVALAGDDATQFVLIDSNSYPIDLTDNQLEFSVLFRPTSAGQKDAVISVTTSAAVHEVEVSGYAFGTEGNTINDPIMVEFNNGNYTTYGNTQVFSDSYTLPYSTTPDDANDVVYKFTLENDMIVHCATSELDWDSKIAIYSASETPGPNNYLYYNDDSEDMGIRRSGERAQTRGFDSVLMFMELTAGDYYLVVDGSNKTEWFSPYGEYRLDIAAYHFVAPTNLTAEVVSNGISLNWNAPTADHGELYGYTVKRDGFAINPAVITGNSYVDETALAGYEYSYQVVAYYENPTGYSQPSNQVLISFGDLAEVVFQDGFETYQDFSIEFEPWTLYNLDGLNNYAIEGFEWENMAEPYAFMVFNPLSVTPAIEYSDFSAPEGNKYLAHFASEGVTNNDWLITPQIALGSNSSFSFEAKSFTQQYGTDNIKLMVSTTGTDPADFQELIPTGEAGEVVPTDWKTYIYSLADYDNETVYVALNVMSAEGFLMMLDSFTVRSDDGAVGNDENVIPTLGTELYANYPNPFNPETNISFNLKDSGNVKLEIYNIKGQKVKTLLNNKLEAGKHSLVWNGTNSNNKPAASGVYFFRMEADNKTLVHKCILMK